MAEVTTQIPAKRRIIVCCDSTWPDGRAKGSHWKSNNSNVMRLARLIEREDTRSCFQDAAKQRTIDQIVYYQSGIGTESSPRPKYGDDSTIGASLGAQVEEAYTFIAHNYRPGDDIYLFGVSRGAYIARMVATFIGEIGLLDRNGMDHFASILVNFQRRGLETSPAEREVIESNLAPWLDPESNGRRRVVIDRDRDRFTIKCIGVWDTVGTYGIPDELVVKHPNNKLFGFKNPGRLGAHIQYAFQALALDERRVDFNCNKFKQTVDGQKKGQVLRQCWFGGTHIDVGGGYSNHDLSDIALIWMAANIEPILALDIRHLERCLEPVARWGEQEPHNSVTGIFAKPKTIQREVPEKPDERTSESIHPSVLARISSYPKLRIALDDHPQLLWDLLVLEMQLKAYWEAKYDPECSHAQAYSGGSRSSTSFSLRKYAKSPGQRSFTNLFH